MYGYFLSTRLAFLVAVVINVQGSPQNRQWAATTTVDATVIPGDKMAAAAFVGQDAATMNVYKALDTSIHALDGSGPPTTASTYSDGIFLAANLARNDTPLALVASGGFFVTAGGRANSFLTPAGELNNLNVCCSNKSGLLYAVGPSPIPVNAASHPNGETTAYPFPVGFMAAMAKILTEAYTDAKGVWTVGQY
ncbi:MAG: hypothetical protein Q9200_001421 [Gallowayella weberi]